MRKDNRSALNYFRKKSIKTNHGSGIQKLLAGKIPANILMKNQCIQYLNRLQLKELKPTRLLERTFNQTTNYLAFDFSFLYSIRLTHDKIAIIWESLELEKSKKTHIFTCDNDEYNLIFESVNSHLSSESNVRSTLNGNDEPSLNVQEKLKYFRGIRHENYEQWARDIEFALPEILEFKDNLGMPVVV